MALREILYCNLTVLHEKKKVIVPKVVYKDVDGMYRNQKLFKEPVQVLNIDIIKSLGFENKQQSDGLV